MRTISLNKLQLLTSPNLQINLKTRFAAKIFGQILHSTSTFHNDGAEVIKYSPEESKKVIHQGDKFSKIILSIPNDQNLSVMCHMTFSEFSLYEFKVECALLSEGVTILLRGEDCNFKDGDFRQEITGEDFHAISYISPRDENSSHLIITFDVAKDDHKNTHTTSLFANILKNVARKF